MKNESADATPNHRPATGGHLLRTVSQLRAAIIMDDVFVLAGSIAYSAILSLFPMLIGLIVVLSQFVDAHRAEQAIVGSLGPYLPPSALAMVRATLEAVMPARGTTGILIAAGWVWSATALASALRHSLNRVLHARRVRSFWHRKLLELIMVMLAGGFLSLSLLASAAAVSMSALRPLAAASTVIVGSRQAALLATISSWILSGLAFFLTYRFLPNVRLTNRSLLLGGVTAMFLFEGTRTVFFWYLRTLAAYPIVYGPLVGVVVFLVWVYLVALVLLVAAEVMALVERPEWTTHPHSPLTERQDEQPSPPGPA